MLESHYEKTSQMPARIVVHFGFHKTGTSTTEHTLLQHSALLSAHCLVLGNPQLGQAPEWAKRFSARRTGENLARFRSAWDDCLGRLNPAPDQAIVISCVDLIGRIPGHPRVHDYGAGSDLVRSMKDGIDACFPNQADAVFFASTRAPDAWLKSLWWQNLKVHRITEDAAEFAARFQPVSDLQAQADTLADAAFPYPLRTGSLEISARHPLGPAGPILDLIDLPQDIRAQVRPHKRLKPSLSDDAMDLLLEINRSDMDDTDLAQTKSDVLAVLKATQEENR